jgi:hypothetical protein
MKLEFFDSVTRSTEGVWFPLRDPRTGNPTDIEFKLAGPDSQTYRNAERDVLKMRSARLRNNGDDSVAFTDEEKVELVAPCVLDWRNLEEGGQPVPYSRDAARRVLTRYPIILRQLDAIIGDARNFLREVTENLQPGRSGDSGSSAQAQAKTS